MEFRKKPELISVNRIIGGELEAKNDIATESNSFRLENIISVCGVNYCMMTSYNTDSDPCHKVYKVNDRVILGATGTFGADENPLDPLIGENVRALSLEEITQIIENYMVSNRNSFYAADDRQYILTGKEFDGSFCIVSFEFVPEHKELCRKVFRPDKEKIATAISASMTATLPPTTFYTIYKANLIKCSSVEDVRKYTENAVCAMTIPDKSTPDPMRVITKAIRVGA